MKVYELLDVINDQVVEIIDEMQEVDASRLGLDQRCGTLYISDKFYDSTNNFVAVRASMDGTLQYYGGFEYIDKECRIVIGDYVFYSAESDRVQDCFDNYYQKDEDTVVDGEQRFY